MNQNQDNASDLVQFIWDKRVFLIVICFVAAVLSAIVSFMIEEKYRSEVIVFPAMTNTVAFTDEIHAEQSSTQFGEEEQAEQMIQVLQSADIRDRIIGKYNLIEHYDIDPDSKLKLTELNETYNDNISFKRTPYGSVKISVLDKDPVYAANIANDISAYLDSAKNRMIKTRAKQAMAIAKSEKEKLMQEITTIVDSMASLSQKGVVDKETRPYLVSGLASATDINTKKLIKQKIEATDKYGSLYTSMEYKLENMNERLSRMEFVYEQAKSDANSSFSHKFEVEKANPAEKKAYPIRWLIVVISTFCALLFSIVLLLANQKIKQLK